MVKVNNNLPFTCGYCGKTTTKHFKSMSHYAYCSDCAYKVLTEALIKKRKGV